MAFKLPVIAGLRFIEKADGKRILQFQYHENIGLAGNGAVGVVDHGRRTVLSEWQDVPCFTEEEIENGN
jgi:hypothetical protein